MRSPHFDDLLEAGARAEQGGAHCQVAQLALEHHLALLQDDRDYQAIRAVRPLKLFP